ncbi:MAG: hypothetical protein QOF67_1099, partial [Mycobacterium sp.]|nr:hypothetical protein [Mycobacterium sp.]
AITHAAVELARQPADIGHFEALRRSYVAMYSGTKTAPPGGLSSDRMMCTVRIIMSSAALRHAAIEYRHHAVNIELAKRMGLDLDDRKLKLVASMWSSFIMTALGDLSGKTDWGSIGIDDVVSRLEAAFAEFIELVDDVRQPV